MTTRIFSLLLLFLSIRLSLSAMPSYQIKRFSDREGMPQNQVTCVMQDSKGYIWISSWNGLSRYDGYNFIHYKARQGDNCPLHTNRILYIRETQKGDILCKCHDGYYMFKTKEKRFVALDKHFKDHGDRYRPTARQKALVGNISEYSGIEFKILYQDRQKGYWIYTHKGLDRITFGDDKISPVKYSDHGEEFVRAIYRDHKGRLFIADKNGFVRITSPDGTSSAYLTGNGTLSVQRKPFGVKVYSIYQDSRGYVWMGCKPEGLFRLKDTGRGGFSVKYFSHDSKDKYSLSCNSIYSIAEDKRGRILLGTYGGGLNIVENAGSDNPQFINSGNRLRNFPYAANFIHDIKLLPSGILLIGTNTGLYTCRISDTPQRMMFYANRRVPSEKTSLSNDQIMSILHSHDGKLYVATYGGGLNIIKSKELLSDKIEFHAMTTDNGMASDVALSMCEDASGKIWIVSEHTIMEYNPSTNTFSNITNGLFTEGFSFSEVPPLYVKSDNSMILGTTQGALTIRLKNIGKSTFKPKIVFDTSDSISLSPDEKTLSVGFAALDYNKNEPIRYAYKLEGVDKEWLYTVDNHVNLSNIPAGTFRLRVRSTNGDGVWMPNEACITISRTPYFNERPVAWMIYGGLILAIVFVAVKVMRYIRRLEQEIKKMRLSGDEKMEYIKVRLGDMMDRSTDESDGDVNEDAFIENSEFKSKVETFMKANISNPDLSVSAFAKEMGVSRSVLYLQMKNIYGSTPNTYIQDLRIEMASRLLRQDRNLNISEIAYQCGFSDPKYFSRCLKKAKGCTPTEYRERFLNPKNAAM